MSLGRKIKRARAVKARKQARKAWRNLLYSQRLKDAAPVVDAQLARRYKERAAAWEQSKIHAVANGEITPAQAARLALPVPRKLSAALPTMTGREKSALLAAAAHSHEKIA